MWIKYGAVAHAVKTKNYPAVRVRSLYLQAPPSNYNPIIVQDCIKQVACVFARPRWQGSEGEADAAGSEAEV